MFEDDDFPIEVIRDYGYGTSGNISPMERQDSKGEDFVGDNIVIITSEIVSIPTYLKIDQLFYDKASCERFY